MVEFRINEVIIEDTFCETFDAYIARILITSINRKWALEAALEAKGLGRSATIPPSEASMESEVKPNKAPDGRPGFIIQVIDRRYKQLKHWLIVRIRKGVVPYPKTSVFDALPRELAEEFIDIKGTMVQKFGDGFEQETEAFGREVFKIPKMDGWFYVEKRFGIIKGITGGMFLILANSDKAALESAERALEGIATIPYVVGKFAASGSKVGGKRYKEAIATTNDAYCPVLRHQKGSRISENVKCIYEVIVSGLRQEDLHNALRIGIENATEIPGVLMITATNYGGTLGKGKIFLHDLFRSKTK
ncbi:MAG: formylmethanofuran--tetrahydromethanopterin N-formyltransferase [Candidatus Hodarchaeota archaeon]